MIPPCITNARYGIIASVSASSQDSSNVTKEKCIKVLQTSKVKSTGFQIGLTKVLSMYCTD